MKSPFYVTPLVQSLAALFCASTFLQAQLGVPPETQKRLDALKAGYESYVLQNVTKPYEDGLKGLNEKVKPALHRASADAAQRKNLDALVRIKSDTERIDAGGILTDTGSPVPDLLKHIYAAYKLELEKLDSARKTSLADAKQRYDKGLMQIQDELTTAQKVDGALLVKKLREGLAVTGVEMTTPSTNTLPILKDGAYANSLGMHFVPVDFEGKTLLTCIWATRLEDYAAYANEMKGLDKNWASGAANAPVDQISWHEATAFCEWLTKKERKEKLIKSPQVYRLPTGLEWSAGEAVFDEKFRANWEWCEDVSGKDANGEELRVIRGKGRSGGAHHMGRYKNMGFRIILDGLTK